MENKCEEYPVNVLTLEILQSPHLILMHFPTSHHSLRNTKYFMPYFLVSSSAETGKVKQIIFRFAQCLFHICWEFPLETEQNHICSWNKFILVGKQIPATSAQCFWYTRGEDETPIITNPCNLVWMFFLFGHKNKGWPYFQSQCVLNPVKVLGKFKWTLLKQTFLFFWKYFTEICPVPHLPKTKPCPICSCFMGHL